MVELMASVQGLERTIKTLVKAMAEQRISCRRQIYYFIVCICVKIYAYIYIYNHS